ncbi:hypothetical protein [Amycolatopsis sp. NPDC054798]
MRLDEVDRARALIERQLSENHADAAEGRDFAFEFRPGLEADERAVQREAAAHEAERAVRDSGRLPHGYMVRVASTLTFDGDVAAQRDLVICPECGAERGHRLWARGDAEHSAWLVCEAGHEWTHEKVVYDWVRLVLDRTEALRSATGGETPAVVLDHARLKLDAGPRYLVWPSGS